MAQTSTPFLIPERKLNVGGTERRVGFEFEFSGVGLANTAAIIQELLGGTIESKHRFAYSVKGTRLGHFEIESDASMLSQRKWEKYARVFGISPGQGFMGETLESLVANVSEELVPYEIVSPPIPFSQMSEMETLREKLQEAGAQGTHTRFYAAYGMQFNPEMPDFKVETLLGYMRAFFLLYDRLLLSEDIPLARKVLPFIDPFPTEYIEQVLNPDYRPHSVQSFMRDYLEYNPTRNRPLDWLPLFAHLDQNLVFEYEVERELIKPRPTLHYRLPSSLIDDPNWTIAGEWNKWVEIERLASDPKYIEQMSEEFLRLGQLDSDSFSMQRIIRSTNDLWIKRSDEFVKEFMDGFMKEHAGI
ncbi:MAG: amidoligase [Proteobacteria bacterium]|nr:MAG: amidoligase [Pseudomonadota bacterium]